MNPEPASRSSNTWNGGRLASIVAPFTAWAAAAGAIPERAVAQVVDAASPNSGTASNSEFVEVFERLDGLTIGLIVAAVAIVALLIWRVAATVRRERPVDVPRRRAPHTVAADSLDRATVHASTDWGFDQNKRAALARSAVTVENASVGLPSIEHAVTQWSVSDVFRAQDVEVAAPDSLGSSPNTTASPYRTGANPYFKRETPVPMMEVEEVADTLLQAELLVQLGDPKQAMTLLSHHIRETEKPGPAVWLMLLSLYQSTGREAQYNALGAGFRMLFNSEVPAWAASQDLAARDIESYPQVLARLQAGWAGGEARVELESLLNDDRGGSRQGFSLNAYRELLFLSEIQEMLAAMSREEAERQGIRSKLASPA